jgi:hypothetical protein
MADNNTFLQSIVKDAQTVCLEKFNLAKTSLGPNNDDVKNLKKDLDRIFSTMAKPGFWTNPVDSDGTPIVLTVITLGKSDAARPIDVVVKIKGVLQSIEVNVLDMVLNTPPLNPKAKVPSDLNTQALNALRITRQQIAIRLQKFAQANQDLSQDPDFKPRQARQDQLVDTYRNKLLNNLIFSKLTDVNVIKQNGNFIAASTSKTAFFSSYDTLSNFIQKKVGVV